MNKKKLIELRCKAWGITEDEYYCNQCSDFSLEDMARAYRRGKNKGIEFANETTKELEKENAELKDKLNNLSSVAEVRLGNWQKYKKENTELKELLREFVNWANWQGNSKCPSFKSIQDKAEQFLKED